MRKYLAGTIFLWLVVLLTGPVASGAAEKKDTVYVNENGETVRGNWSSGEIIEVKTEAEYDWHLNHFDPSAHYEVAPWLYDAKNLAGESGDDEDRR